MSSESVQTGLFDRTLGSGDHKTIGRLWVFSGLALGLAALVLRFVAALEQLDTGDVSILEDANELIQVWSLSRDLLVFGGIVAVFVGIGTFIVPLQVGASSMAFARGAAAAYWMWLVSAALLIASYIGNGGPGGGTRDFVVLWALALGGMMVATAWALICIATTVIGARAPGMRLEMVPLTSWSYFVFALLGLLTVPIQVGQLIISFIDVRGGYQSLVDTTSLASVMDTITIAPSVYWLAIPALGIALDAIAVHSNRPLRFHRESMVAVGLLALTAFGAPVTSFGRRAGALDFDNAMMVIALLASVLPILAALALAGESLKTGTPRFSVPLGAGLAAGLFLLGGAVVALLGTVEPIVGFVVEVNNELADRNDVPDLPDWLVLNGTTYNAGVTALVITGALLGCLAGISHWGHKMWGHRANAGLGSLALLAFAGGGAVWALGEVFGGFGDQPALPAIADTDGIASAGNLLVLLGVAGVAGGVGLLLLIAGTAGFTRTESQSEPWTGTTLEWMTDSPPPYGNFDSQPSVSSANPLLDMDLSGPSDEVSPELEEVSA
ncbi:MAG: cbb3-type cytochrome c oxidase subunit I [Acidimicrobiales bacterium]